MAVCAACGVENRDEARFCDSCGVPVETAFSEQRKTVTAVFCDVVGSTALADESDPEAVRIVLARYFERMRGIVERHGGTVQKFIGDAVVAIFGVPIAHEDDALRALRAAQAMREALPALGIDGRIGVNTGEVMTSVDDTLVTGDAVNVAARLQQAAAPGEVLLGKATLLLARGAVEVNELEPVAVKGKSEPVAAFRLFSVREPAAPVHATGFVGRRDELAFLTAAWRRAFDGERCELVTVVGEPGVGKSRLVDEFTARLGVPVASGRCLSYGEGITYRPVTEVIKQLTKSHLESAGLVPLVTLLGDGKSTTSPDEIAWAFRELLEQHSPLLVVFDDIQWGEETFLDLVEQTALGSTRGPLLIVCIGRPELIERRPSWRATLRLAPMPPGDVDGLIPDRIKGTLREKIVRASAGIPLFAVEMAVLAADPSNNNAPVVPATLKALLTARLDQLNPAERRVLECASVEGEQFGRRSVLALDPGNNGLGSALRTLSEKELIRLEPTQGLDQQEYRFCHLLIRDAAYDGLPKARRAQLHERLADLLAGSTDLAERDELIGYHLEQACHYRLEVMPDDAIVSAIALRAAGSLTAAGKRATARLDPAAAVNLLGRARELRPTPDAELDIEYVVALRALGGSVPNEERILTNAAARAAADGDRASELHVRLAALERGGRSEGVGLSAQQLLVEEALQLFEQSGDEVGSMRAWIATAMIERQAGRMKASIDAAETALTLARAAGQARAETSLIVALTWGRLWGPTPVADALAWLATQRAVFRNYPSLIACRAALVAMRGDFEEARSLQAVAAAAWEERVGGIHSGIQGVLYEIEMLAGHYLAAEAVIRGIGDQYEREGENRQRSALLGELGRTLSKLGRHGEAERASLLSEELAETDDVTAQVAWRLARANAYAHRGRSAEARHLALQAVELTARTDCLNARGDALMDLASVLTLANASREADDALKQAHALYDLKGNLVMATRVGGLLPTQ